MTLLFTFPEQTTLAKSLLTKSRLETGNWEWRHFPDQESYVRVLSDVASKSVIIMCSLNNPDTKALPLIFLARTLKELGATKVTLVSPYLGYMRQDFRFNPGEAITSSNFAQLLSQYIDELVTIDPHLHRIKRLEDVYACPCTVLSASPLMAQWIAENVSDPLIIGPDKESEQWVQNVSAFVNAPYIILDKIRRGDNDVDIRIPDIDHYRERTPVLIDDIISSAATMMESVKLLRQRKFAKITCVATHGIFAEGSYERLIKIGNVTVTTTNCIPHISNAIDVSILLLKQDLLS